MLKEAIRPKKFSPKVVPIQRSDYISFVMSVEYYYRHPATGKPTNLTLFRLPSIHSNTVGNIGVQQAFHQLLDRKLKELIVKYNPPKNDLQRIRDVFESYVPRPVLAPVPVPSASALLVKKFPVLRGAK